MDRFLRYFVAPIRRVEFQAQVGKQQANSVIADFVTQKLIKADAGLFQLTDAGVSAWQVYVGIAK